MFAHPHICTSMHLHTVFAHPELPRLPPISHQLILHTPTFAHPARFSAPPPGPVNYISQQAPRRPAVQSARGLLVGANMAVPRR